MFDVSEKATAIAIEDEGAAIPVLDENDEPAVDGDGNPVTITVVGMNSATYRKVESWQRKQLRALGGRAQSPDEQAAMQSEFVARCCKGWSGFTDKGQPLPFTTENATKMFQALPFVQRQIERAIGNHQRFFSASSTI